MSIPRVRVGRDVVVEKEKGMFERVLAFFIGITAGFFSYAFGVGEDYLTSGAFGGVAYGFLKYAFTRYWKS